MRNSVTIPIFILLAAMFTLLQSSTMVSWGQTTTTATGSPPLVSTRGNFNLGTAELLRGHNSTDYMAMNVPGLQSSQCPKEMVVLVHGIWVGGRIYIYGVNAVEDSSEIFDRTRMSLAHNHYTNPLVGFSCLIYYISIVLVCYISAVELILYTKHTIILGNLLIS